MRAKRLVDFRKKLQRKNLRRDDSLSRPSNKIPIIDAACTSTKLFIPLLRLSATLSSTAAKQPAPRLRHPRVFLLQVPYCDRKDSPPYFPSRYLLWPRSTVPVYTESTLPEYGFLQEFDPHDVDDDHNNKHRDDTEHGPPFSLQCRRIVHGFFCR